MTVLRAIVVVANGVLGTALVVSCHPRIRRANVASRVEPYLGALSARASSLATPTTASGGLLGAVFDDVGARVHRRVGHGDLDARLDAAGLELSPSRFRARQVSWALAGFTGALAVVALVANAGRSVSVLGGLLVAFVSAAVGALACDRSLTRAVERRRDRIVSELPTVVDLVCLAVTAGESLRAALDLVATNGSGALARELRRVLREARTGRSLAEVLDERARQIGVAPLVRVVDAIVAAQERGLPLAETLAALATDVREARTREVIEVAGRKQVSMLIPVVGLILPVAVVFAFYPGVVAIRMLAQ